MPFIFVDAGPDFPLSILPVFPNFLIHILVNHVLEGILLNVLEQTRGKSPHFLRTLFST